MWTSRRWVALSVVVTSVFGTARSADAGVDVRVGPGPWRNRYHHHHHHPRPIYVYEPVPVYQPVIVEQAPIVERRVYVERPVYVQQAPPPGPVLAPIQTDQPPLVNVQTPAASVQVESQPTVDVIRLPTPAPAVFVRTKGRLPAGPTTCYTCVHSYTGVQFDVQIPAWMKPKHVDHGRTEIELEYRDGEIEIEFRPDGSAVVDYDF